MPAEIAADLVDRYVSMIVDHQPTEATALGDHRRDADLPDLSQAGVAAFTSAVSRLLEDTERAMADIGEPAEAADREAYGDLSLLRDNLRARQFWLTQRPSLHRDPLAALNLASSAIHELLRRVDLPMDGQRAAVTAAIARATALPALFEQAGRLLEASPEPHLMVAKQRCDGFRPLLEQELTRRAADVGVDVAAAGDAAREGMAGVAAYAALLDELSDRPAVDWRLGSDDHAVVLRSSLGTELEAGEVEQRARKALAEARDELVEVAGRHWDDLVAPGQQRPDDPDALAAAVLEAIGTSRQVPRETLVDQARAAVADARAFAIESGLTDVPPASLLTVTEVPAFLQGVAVAFISPPPPLEPSAGSTYYLSPVPAHWDDGQASSFLREYNAAALRSLAIHEGYPGHFVQLAHASRHPRLARRLLWSSAFAEGWAVYIERIAALRDFGDVAYRVTQLKMAMRVAANALLDVLLHLRGAGDDEARALLQGAFQEEQEAAGKVIRGKITAGQLCSYFVGGVEMWDLRAQEEDRLGAAFDERDFHLRVLSHGTPTTTILRATLADPEAVVRRPFA